LLWEKDLDQIQFFALDDFVNSKNEAPEIPTAVAIDRPLSAPGRAMSGANDEVAQELVERATATTDEGRPVFELDDNDLKQIQSAIDGEVAKDPFEGFVEIVLEVVRNDADGQRLGKTLGILRNLIGSLAERADFGRAASIIEQLRMAPNLVQGEVNLLDQTMEAVAQDETMKRIQVHLEEAGDLPPDAPLYRFLRQIPPSRLEWLCEWLALPGHARELSTILAEVGSDQWDLFVRHLDSGNGQVVKSIIVILGRLDPEAAVKQISRVASHDDPEVREMATMVLAKSGHKSVARNLLPSLSDKSRKTRQHALDYFARVSFPMAFPVIRDIVASSGSQDDPKWLLLVMRALLRSDANKALDHLESTCFKKSLFRALFKKSDLQQQQLAALYALGKDDQPATLRLLESLSKSMDKNIRNKAAHQLKSRQSRKESS
ncbi:MAG: HEAT repeat domain-containing protein, partial [Planctomycetota bacterium]